MLGQVGPNKCPIALWQSTRPQEAEPGAVGELAFIGDGTSCWSYGRIVQMCSCKMPSRRRMRRIIRARRGNLCEHNPSMR